MAKIYIKNGRVILKDRIADGATVTIDDGRIAAITRKPAPKKGSFVIDAKGCFVSPGFIDCHIHGEPEKIFINEARHGTTAFVIAESCAPWHHIYKRAEGIREFIRTHPLGPNVLGLRIEGPYINRAKAGAQDTSYIRKPDVRELLGIMRECSPILKIMTIAPELKNALPIIKLLRKHRIIASIGHSDATYEAAVEGIDAGITHSTHTFNATSGIDKRYPGVAGAVLLDDRVTAEIILDLIHVHRALFKLLIKSKKKDKVIAVTDSLVAEVIHSRRGSLNLPYGQSVQATGGAYRFADGRLAGSSLTMIGALKNMVKISRLSLRDALDTITVNPAKLLGLQDKKGAIATGKDADIVVFDKEFDVKMTLIRGNIVYSQTRPGLYK